MKQTQPLLKFTLIYIIISILTSCSGGKAVVSESWSLVELITTGERIDNFTETIEVPNCGIVQPKTISCSAGTNNEFIVGFSGGNIVIEGNVSRGLNIGHETGQSIELAPPPDGFIDIYIIQTIYRVIAGEALARSSNGNEQTTSYSFKASCSIEATSKQQVSCSNNTSSLQVQPTNISSQPTLSYPAKLCPVPIRQNEIDILTIGIADLDKVRLKIMDFNEERIGDAGAFPTGTSIPANVIVATNFDEHVASKWSEYPVIPIAHSGSYGLFQTTEEYIAPNSGACRIIVP